MKRISFWPVVLLAFTPGMAGAYYYNYYFEGTHYSPYAWGLRGTGLVPGGTTYSPYALSYQGSGLVSVYAQYTPYARSYYNSGLVPYYGPYEPYPSFTINFKALTKPLVPALHRLPPVVHPRPPARGPRPVGHGCAGPSRPVASAPDAMDTIRRHLQGKGLASLSIDRILRVDNQLVSVDVLVRDRNLLIKYWNPREVERLKATESYQQKAYANYKKSWDRYAAQFQQAGGEIFYVNAAEPQTIVAALESCPKLGPSPQIQPQPALYARH
jgi:hypothetical protein